MKEFKKHHIQSLAEKEKNEENVENEISKITEDQKKQGKQESEGRQIQKRVFSGSLFLRATLFFIGVLVVILLFLFLTLAYNELKSKDRIKSEIITLQKDFEARFNTDKKAFDQKWENERSLLREKIKEKRQLIKQKSIIREISEKYQKNVKRFHLRESKLKRVI